MGFPKLERAKAIELMNSFIMKSKHKSMHEGVLEEGVAKLVEDCRRLVPLLSVDRSCFTRNFNKEVDEVMARLAATLDAFIAVDGITHAKMRHTAYYTEQQIDYLSLMVALLIALYGRECPAVRDLDFKVEDHVIEAARRVVEVGPPPAPDAKSYYTKSSYAEQNVPVRSIEDALIEFQKPQGVKGCGVLAEPEFDADNVLAALAFLCPDRHSIAVTLDRDHLVNCGNIITPGAADTDGFEDAQALNQWNNPFHASEPARTIWLLFQICCGSDFCKVLADCRRGCSTPRFVAAADKVEAHCKALFSGSETTPWTLDQTLDGLNIPAEMRPLVVAIIKLYDDGPLFSRDGALVRTGAFICDEASSPAARELNEKRLAWVAASDHHQKVEAVLRLAWTPKGLRLLKALTSELESDATPKGADTASKRAEALLAAVSAVRAAVGPCVLDVAAASELAAIDAEVGRLRDRIRYVKLLETQGDGRLAELELRDFRTRALETQQRLVALRRADRTLRDRDRVHEERERLLATVGPERAERLTALLERFDQDLLAHLGADLLLKVLQVVRAAVEGLTQGDPAVATGRQWARVAFRADASYGHVPTPILLFLCELHSVCHEKARTWVARLIAKATAALAYIDACDSGADPRTAAAAAAAIARDMPDRQKVELLQHAAAKGLPRREPGAQGTSEGRSWAESLMSGKGSREKFRNLSISTLTALACLQGCKKAVGTDEAPKWARKLRNAAFAALEDKYPAAALALVRPRVELEAAPAAASKPPATKRRRVFLGERTNV